MPDAIVAISQRRAERGALLAQREVAGEEAEGRRRVTRRKAAAGAAVGLRRRPSARHSGRCRRTRRATTGSWSGSPPSSSGIRPTRDEGRHAPTRLAPGARRARAKGSGRQTLTTSSAAEQPRRPSGCRRACTPDGEPVVAPGKAVGVGKQARDRQVEADEVPGGDGDETGEQQGGVAQQLAAIALRAAARGRLEAVTSRRPEDEIHRADQAQAGPEKVEPERLLHEDERERNEDERG